MRIVNNKLISLINFLVDATSFNIDTRKALEALNKRIEQAGKFAIRHNSHPGGFSRELYKRRISIAEAYIKIAHALESDKYEERLLALKTLIQLSLHAKNVATPLNTARVQIALMKKAIKRKGNMREQLELLSEFTVASFGQWPVIRRLLNEMNMIQVPETGQALRELELGWDNHIHDSTSEGRKTPAQVLLDAFVKGISSVTISYYDIVDQVIREAMGAGEILGIDVRIGLEFSVGKSKNRRHYTYLPPKFNTADEILEFFKKNNKNFESFLAGLRKNAENRKVTLETMIKHFNETHLIKLNSGYEKDSLLYMQPLQLDDLKKIVMNGQYSRIHLGSLLFNKLFEVTHKRVLHLKMQYQVARNKKEMGLISQWELDQITQQYETMRKYYEEMSPERLKEKFLEDRAIIDYDSVFGDEDEIFADITLNGGEIKFIHPLEVGLKTAVATIIKHYKYITRVETFNNTDSVKRNPNELILFNRFVEIMNNKSFNDLMKFLDEWEITDIKKEEAEAAFNHYQKKSLIPVCGSDATGRDPKIPGMGFIKSRSIPKSIRKWYMSTHSTLPSPIASLIMGKGQPIPEDEWSKLADDEKHIILMGRSMTRPKNLVGDENETQLISPSRYFKYLNPFIKNFFRFGIGFLPAYLTFAFLYNIASVSPAFSQYGGANVHIVFGLVYTGIWFFITFFRNILVDLIAAHGLDAKYWSWHDINFENAFQSLFWTGFSVPILNFVKNWFDGFWPAAGISSVTLLAVHEVVKFFFLCISNGLYIVTHNRIRNFDQKVIRANFFRSIIAWPFATIFSPIGTAMGIPSIVQTKFWSDVIAGFIEGSGKFTQRVVIRKRDLNEILPLISAPEKNIRMAAALDILYIWAKQQRGNTCLEQILLNKSVFYKNIFKKENPEEVEKQAQKAKRLFDDLFNFFTEEGCALSLSYFILEYYSSEDALVLNNIVGNHFEQFKEWLYEIQAVFKKYE